MSSSYTSQSDTSTSAEVIHDREECREVSYLPQFEECGRRKECLKKCISPKIIKAYSVDTCLLEYRPRLITVPSKKYASLDDAIRTLAPFKGGYVIRLRAMPNVALTTYNINQSICGDVDNVYILGDTSPFVGIPFIQTCRTDPIATDIVDVNCRQGYGPFRLIVTGRKITVKGIKDPDFSCLCAGRIVSIVRRDGTIIPNEIVAVNGNTINFRNDLGFSLTEGVPYPGEGFFINPNISISSNSDTLQLITSNTLRIEGVIIDMPILLRLGTTGGHLDLRHCVIRSPIYVVGRYYIPTPNIHLSMTILPPGSIGNAYYQSILGRNARLVCDGNASAGWFFSIFADAGSPIHCSNGAVLSIFGSDVINNCVGMVVWCNSTVAVQSVIFCGNRVGFTAHYNSCISSTSPFGISDPETGIVIEAYAPQFLSNYIGFSAGWGSFVMVLGALFRNNRYEFLEDSRVRTVDVNPIGDYGAQFSLVEIFPNVYAFDTPADFGCQGDDPAEINLRGVLEAYDLSRKPGGLTGTA